MNNLLKRTILLLFITLGSCLSAFSQFDSDHEFSGWASVGSSSLNFTGDNTSSKSSIGATFGIGYNYYFDGIWSLGTGLEYSSTGGDLKIDHMTDFFVGYIDPQQTQLGQYSLDILNYKEKVTNSQLNIPITIQYLSPSYMHKFYGAAGVKLGLPLSGSAKSSAATYNSTHIPLGSNDEIYEPNNTIPGGSKSDVKFKMAIMATAEIGVRWSIGESLSLYSGAFVDYTINNVLKKGKNRMIESGAEGGSYTFNSALTSTYRSSEKARERYVTTESHPYTIGLKVRVSFNVGGNRNYKIQQRRAYIKNVIMHPEVVKGLFDNMDSESIKKQVEEKEDKMQKINMDDLIKGYGGPDGRVKEEQN